MTDLLRQEVTSSADTLVVKVGTRVLTHAGGKLNLERIAAFAEQISALVAGGRQVVLVSSGAVGAGMSQLGLTKRPTDIARLQAVAAVGQTNLIESYDKVFRQHGRHAAQILLTAEDLDHRTRYLNVRNTILSLLEFGAVPIINENDTVAVDELLTTFGDNDRLAALVTNLLRAPLLVILSDVAGLYNGDPSLPDSMLLHTITDWQGVEGYVRDRLTGMSKGGMASKLKAARMVTAAGENMIIASGNEPNVLARLMAGETIGTLFTAQGKTIPPRKRWIGFSAQPCGRLTLDAGAAQAVRSNGRSLLAIGVTAVEGRFEKGDIVSIADSAGQEIARGLSNYSADDLVRIRGLNSTKIAEVLGHQPYEEVVHRNNMTLV